MKKTVAFLASSATVLLGFFVLTVLFAPSSGQCSITGSVTAQDNPCLAAEATISALQFQNLSLQATLSARTVSGAPANSGDGNQLSGTDVAGLPFTETFDNNDRGWELRSIDTYSVSLSRGALSMRTADGRICARVTVPNLNNAEFYMEVDVTPGGSSDASSYNSGYVGFVLGDVTSDEGDRDYFLIGRDDASSGTDWYVFGWRTDYQERENTRVVSILTATQYREMRNSNSVPLWTANDTIKLSFESRNGLYTLYYEDEQAESLAITPNGDEVGLAFCSEGTRESLQDGYYSSGDSFGSARFDNLVVRQAR